MSNTAPAYLEGFQRIVISVDEISGQDDIKHFVSDHKDLTASPEVPQFERHPYLMGEAVSYNAESQKYFAEYIFIHAVKITIGYLIYNH